MMSKANRTTVFRVVAAATLCLSFVIFGYRVMRSTDYANNWPRTPQPELGRTIQHQARASIRVFISAEDAQHERNLVSAWQIAIGLSILFGVLSGDFLKIFKPNGENK
jgi:hypothetical protein